MAKNEMKWCLFFCGDDDENKTEKKFWWIYFSWNTEYIYIYGEKRKQCSFFPLNEFNGKYSITILIIVLLIIQDIFIIYVDYGIVKKMIFSP